MTEKKVTKTVEICKAFGSDIEEATHKLMQKFKGVCIINPDFENADKDFDCGTFTKEGKELAWAKFTMQVTLDETPVVANHPEIKQQKPAKKPKKAKVA